MIAKESAKVTTTVAPWKVAPSMGSLEELVVMVRDGSRVVATLWLAENGTVRRATLRLDVRVRSWVYLRLATLALAMKSIGRERTVWSQRLVLRSHRLLLASSPLKRSPTQAKPSETSDHS